MDNLLDRNDRQPHSQPHSQPYSQPFRCDTDDRRAYPSCPEQHSDDPRAGHVDPYGGGDYRV